MNALQEILAGLERPADLEPTQRPQRSAGNREYHPRQLVSQSEALKFILSGRATVTFKGKKDRYTFRISAPPKKDANGQEIQNSLDQNSDFRFVHLMNGPDNESSYTYLGYIRRGVYFHGAKSKIGRDAPSEKAFWYVYSNLARGKMPDGLEIWHEGRCGRCGHKLTVPESIASGYGPECINHIH